MADLTERLSRIQFVVLDVDGVFTDGRVFYDAEGRPFRAVHAWDVTGLTLWHLANGKTALVSGLGSKAIEAVAATWKCAENHMWVKDKAQVCRDLARRHGLPLEAMAFMGDDIIDLKAMETVGLSVAVGNAMPEVRSAAHLVTQAAGGHGAVRELVHLILRAQDRLDEIVNLYCNRRGKD